MRVWSTWIFGTLQVEAQAAPGTRSADAMVFPTRIRGRRTWTRTIQGRRWTGSPSSFWPACSFGWSAWGRPVRRCPTPTRPGEV